MSNPRDSDQDLGPGSRLAAEEADLRLDTRLRQRLAASGQFVPAPSEAMLAGLREAARQQAASATSGGLFGWLSQRPRHMWAAIGSVAVASAAVAGLVMLQNSDRGVDRQAAAVLDDRRSIPELAAAPAAAPPSQVVAGAVPAEAPASPDAARKQADKSLANQDIPALAAGPKSDSRVTRLDEYQTADKAEASFKDGKFAAAPAAELEDDRDSARARQGEASEGKQKKGDVYGEVVAGGVAPSPPTTTATSSPAFAVPVAPATPSKVSSAPADEADVGAATGTDAKLVSIDATSKTPATKTPTKPLPVDVAALAKAGRCSEASKAATLRRKSDVGYTSAQAAQDLAPCLKASEQRKAPAKTKGAPPTKK